MEDTLRYFFSAVFQGFAALITLGIMFYLYYLDKSSKKIDLIEEKLIIYKASPDNPEIYQEYLQYGIIKYLKSHVVNKGTYSMQTYQISKLITKYDSIIEQKKLLSRKMRALLNIALAILTLSLISLFLVGYFSWLNLTLAVFGIISIILSVIFFSLLYAFSVEIINGPY